MQGQRDALEVAATGWLTSKAARCPESDDMRASWAAVGAARCLENRRRAHDVLRPSQTVAEAAPRLGSGDCLHERDHAQLGCSAPWKRRPRRWCRTPPCRGLLRALEAETMSAGRSSCNGFATPWKSRHQHCLGAGGRMQGPRDALEVAASGSPPDRNGSATSSWSRPAAEPRKGFPVPWKLGPLQQGQRSALEAAATSELVLGQGQRDALEVATTSGSHTVRDAPDRALAGPRGAVPWPTRRARRARRSGAS